NGVASLELDSRQPRETAPGVHGAPVCQVITGSAVDVVGTDGSSDRGGGLYVFIRACRWLGVGRFLVGGAAATSAPCQYQGGQGQAGPRQRWDAA
ncbi:MAG: hypothetical protein KGP14_15700, partial [Betaproteobacteria bacterium]|nr:hypothetical protein [Betaproteobacteria bacterium]